MPSEKTIKAIEHLESIGKQLNYDVRKEYPVYETSPAIISLGKKIDVALLKNNELKVAIEVESGISKGAYKNDLDKFEFLSCKCLILSGYVARTMSPELLNYLINSRNRMEIVTKRNKYLVYNDVLYKIVKFIENNPGTYLREISRSLNMHTEIVRRCLKTLSQYVDIKEFGDQNFSLPQLPMLISMKEGYTAEGIIRTINVMRKLELSRTMEKRNKRVTMEELVNVLSTGRKSA